MRWSLIRRKLQRVDRALDKAIGASEIPGAVVLARMPRDGERLEHVSVRGLAVMRPERIAMTREQIHDLLAGPQHLHAVVLPSLHTGMQQE